MIDWILSSEMSFNTSTWIEGLLVFERIKCAVSRERSCCLTSWIGCWRKRLKATSSIASESTLNSLNHFNLCFHRSWMHTETESGRRSLFSSTTLKFNNLNYLSWVIRIHHILIMKLQVQSDQTLIFQQNQNGSLNTFRKIEFLLALLEWHDGIMIHCLRLNLLNKPSDCLGGKDSTERKRIDLVEDRITENAETQDTWIGSTITSNLLNVLLNRPDCIQMNNRLVYNEMKLLR